MDLKHNKEEEDTQTRLLTSDDSKCGVFAPVNEKKRDVCTDSASNPDDADQTDDAETPHVTFFIESREGSSTSSYSEKIPQINTAVSVIGTSGIYDGVCKDKPQTSVQTNDINAESKGSSEETPPSGLKHVDYKPKANSALNTAAHNLKSTSIDAGATNHSDQRVFNAQRDAREGIQVAENNNLNSPENSLEIDVSELDVDSGRYSPNGIDTTRQVRGSDVTDVIQQVRVIQSTLLRDHDEEKINKSLQELISLCPNMTGTLQCFLEETHVNVHIVSALLHLPTSLHIQRNGLQLLCLLSGISDKLAMSMIKHSIHSWIVKTLASFPSDQLIQEHALKLSAILLPSPEFHDRLLVEGCLCDVMQAACEAMRTFPNSVSVYLAASEAVLQLVEEDLGHQDKWLTSVGYTMVASIRSILDQNLLLTVLKILKHISKQKKHSEMLISHDLHVTLIEVCCSTKSRDDVICEAMELICAMSSQETVQNTLLQTNFVKSGLRRLMDGHQRSYRIQKAGLYLIRPLVQSLLSKSEDIKDLASTLVRQVYYVMFGYMDKAELQEDACHIISQVLEHYPEANQWIGDSIDKQQYPIHCMCLGALLMYWKRKTTYTCICETIYWLAADNVRLCKALESKNAHIAILEGLKHHEESCDAVAAGCKALRGLCIFLYEHKSLVVQEEAFDLLTKLQSCYLDDVNVQIQVLSLIICLTDIGIVQYQCFVAKVPQHIISTMKKFPDEALMQETGLEAFAALSASDGGPELLVLAGALTSTLDALIKYPENELIQKKGMIVLQLFSGQAAHQPSAVRELIAAIIQTILSKESSLESSSDSSSKGLLTEACVALQLLSESDQMMSNLFVRNGCHHFLFGLLEKPEYGKGLESLAGECLYVLSQEQNLKSSMLLSACHTGMMPATECLIELGADVNTSREGRTPLLVAVQNQQDDVVELLLRYNIQDLLNPLRYSLSQRYDHITGLLLQQIGHNRQDGIIRWTELDLQSLETTWIETSLTHTLTRSTDWNSQLYLDKIKHSETRRMNRKKKLAHSRSDSAMRPLRVRIRHPSQELTRDVSIVKDEVLRVFQSSSRQLLSRSQSYEDSLFPKCQATTPAQISPIIIARKLTPCINTADDTVFELSPSEELDWRQNTITGANVSYNSQDPRQSPAASRKSSIDDSPWIRKRTRPAKHYSSSSDDNVPIATLSRKCSMPVFPLPHDHHLKRKMSLGSKIAEIEQIRQHPEMATSYLKVLDISDNRISDLSCLGNSQLKDHLVHLEKLDIHGNNLTRLPENLHQNLPSLQLLDATYNAISEFPKRLLLCKMLLLLDLSYNKIKTFDVLGNFSLKKLYLSHNEIKALPDGLGNHLHKLKELLLDHNDIQQLPGAALGLSQLKRLDLSYNTIDQVPYEFLQMCEHLESIDFSSNQLKSLPDEGLAVHLPNLSKVKLRNNRLEEKHPFHIPKFLLVLPELKSLDISENHLTNLPPLSMWRSRIMKSFIANRNKIMQLPLHPSHVWSNLEKLHIAHNSLKELPREIGQLSSLRSLDFSHNPGITSLPDELGRCRNLYEMPIDGLELDLNRTLLNRRVKDIIGYLHNRLKKAQRYYRMKLMVVGFGERGKTTLLNTLMKRSNNKKENPPTVGVLVKDWKYTRFERKLSEDMSGPRLFTNGRKVECVLNTWDFAGQEEFYSTHNCYLSNRAVYLVVFDLRRKVADVERLKVWLTSIRSRAPGCPVIVVGTHLDKLAKDIEKQKEETNMIAEKLREFNIKPGFPNIVGVHLVDASCENESISKLRNSIIHVVHSFEIGRKTVMGEKIPASYVKLSELLTEMARRGPSLYPVITRLELLKLVAEEQLDLDEEELQQAVTFLHESGVILHYDDTSLKELYFIDPGWLCRMMAKIITVRQINPFVMDGILRKKDIKLLFTSNDSSMLLPLIPQYIKLLEKFEIALPHSDTELLIPSKLPCQRPDIHLPSHGRCDKIHRIYRMPHVPIGLMYRLISRLLSLTLQKGFQIMLKLSKFPRKVFWRQGVYIFWSHEAYFMVEYVVEDRSPTETINVTVPASCLGSRLLGQIVDNLDNLIDEWYPGLTCIDPMMGQEILEILAPCSHCKEESGQKEAHLFNIRELQAIAMEKEYVHCPGHDGDMLISELAPDLVLGDIEEEFKLNTNLFQFKESTENRLGDGGFGDVFKGVYGDQEVAVKSYKEIGDVHQLTMLRQEVTILRCLKHPSVVSLVAVGIQPCVVLLELASQGTLASLIKQDRSLTKPLQIRIATQMAEGLEYLHSLMIVFRDMKPDNVLIFSTSLDSVINAKISDYGISRFTSLEGLRAQEGTLGYRAPEVIRKENYSFSADIFSYGLTMYVMLARKHPFYKKDSKGEIDRAIAEEEAIPDMVVPPGSSSNLPDMQQLVMRCLTYLPSDRPTAKMLVQLLQKPDILALQKMVPVSKTTTVECFALEERGVSDSSHQQHRLWIASGDSYSFQLSYINLSDSASKIEGQQFYHGRILCMQYLSEGHLALGTQLGQVWLYNTHTNTLVHSSAQLQDSVLSMKVMPMDREGGLLFVGLANGKVAVLPVHDFIAENDLDPVCLYPGEDCDPVCCMLRMGRRIFLSCGTKIVVLNMAKGIGITIEKIVETDHSKTSFRTPIYTMAAQKANIVFTKKTLSTVYIWDAAKDKVQRTFNTEQVMRLPPELARITALVADNRAIWVGTHSGHIGIIDMNTHTLLAITHRYTYTVRCLLKVKAIGRSSLATVFSGGQGNKSLDGSQESKSSAVCGTVLIWDANFPDQVKAGNEYEKKRQMYKHRMGRQYSTSGDELPFEHQE